MTVKLILSAIAGVLGGVLFGQLFTQSFAHTLATFFVAAPLGAAALAAGTAGAIAAALTGCLAVQYLYEPVRLAAFIGVHAIPVVCCTFAFYAGRNTPTRLAGSRLGRALAVLGVCFALTAAITHNQLATKAVDLAAQGQLQQTRSTLAQSLAYEFAVDKILVMAENLADHPAREQIIDGHFKVVEHLMPWFLGLGTLVVLSHFILGAWAGMIGVLRFGKPVKPLCKKHNLVLPVFAVYMAVPFCAAAFFVTDAGTAFLLRNLGLILSVPVIIYGLVVAHVLAESVRFPKLSLTGFYVVTILMGLYGLIPVAVLGITEDIFNLRAKFQKRET